MNSKKPPSQRLEGFVECIRDGLAAVELDGVPGTFPADLLAEHGIGVNGRFTVTIAENGITLEPRRRSRFNHDEIAQLIRLTCPTAQRDENEDYLEPLEDHTRGFDPCE